MLKYSDITPKHMFLNRRQFIAGATALGGVGLMGAQAAALDYKKTSYSVPDDIALTSKEDATSYNNFYEFGTNKTDPAKHAQKMTIDPWSIEVSGLAGKTGTYDFADVMKGLALEERIYRFRCVEAWSMVVPWIGVSLSEILNKFEPLPSAKYVAFETLNRPEEMPGINWNPRFPWPYVEGLRMDEAMHPLTMMATGMYGEALPKQNGAPLRLVVPWKYGFKSIKSIVKISFTEDEPPTTWNKLQPSEYGFYANVNPEVSHPRWSQAKERVLGGGIFKRPTPMFNGYGDEVASLYAGMDLRQYY